MLDTRNFHVFSKDNRHFLFLTVPVALFAIDAETHAVLAAVERGLQPEGDAARRWEEVNTFVDNYLARARPARPLRSPADITDKVVALYLFVCQQCNLKCSYCYGDEGEYGRRGRMAPETMFDTFRRFFDRESDGEAGQHFLTFFGGEPLMNMALLEQTAAEAEAYRAAGKADIRLCMVTNATLYNERVADFFRRHLSDVTFSLDGPKDCNDVQRIAKSGDSVHDLASANIRKLTEDASFGWSFRSIVTRNSCDRVEEIYEHLSTFNPGGIGIVDVDAPKNSPLHIDDEAYGRFIRQIVEVNRRGLASILEGEAPVAFEYPFYILYYFVARRHALYHCNAGANLLAVTAEGDVYPCHRFVGNEAFCMGKVSDPDLKDSPRYQAIRERFIHNTVDDRPGCRDCWARYLCGGACAKHAWSDQGDIAAPVARHCRYIKTVVEELLPDLVTIMEDPAKRRQLAARLGAAIAGDSSSRAVGAAHAA